MLCHQAHICRFPIQFSINAKWCVIPCLLLQHLESCSPQLPCQPGWQQLVQLGAPSPPHRTKPAAPPVPGLSFWHPGTPQAEMPNNPNTITTPEVHVTAGELVDVGGCDSQKHGHSIAWHHWEASASLITKRSKGTAGEMNSLCLPGPYVYTKPPLADSCPRHSPGPKGILPDCNRCCGWNYGMKTFGLLA